MILVTGGTGYIDSHTCVALAQARTGQHVTGEVADAWLAQLETGNNVDPPECHD